MSLSLILGLLCPALSHTDIWRSPQVGGPDLFTYWRKDPRTCQKYETGLAINFVPSSPTTTLSDVVPYQPMPVAEPSLEFSALELMLLACCSQGASL